MASALAFVVLLCVTSALLIGENEAASCPKGWRQYRSRCFIVRNERKRMLDAEFTCQGLGGNLVSMRDYNEYRFVRGLTSLRRKYWIGLHDSIVEGKWMWTDGTKVTFTMWARNEPNDRWGDEDCVEMNFSKYYWNDVKCSMMLPFVCVKRL